HRVGVQRGHTPRPLRRRVRGGVMRALGAFVAAVVALAVAFVNGTAAAPATITVGHSTLNIPCGSGVQAPADWYMPSGTPSGLVWLVHGWLGTKSDVAPLAQAIATRTGALVVAPSLSPWPWEQGGCWMSGEPLERAVAGLFTDRTALTASARAAGWAAALP